MLLVPPIPEPNDKRRGVILLVVISLLALFAAVGVSFVYYAEAESLVSRMNREAGSISSMTQQHADPEKLLAHFLGQFIYDTTDVRSALRGQSLARNMFGFKTRYGTVTNAGLGASGWIRITSANHGLQTNDIVTISGVGGYPRAFGVFQVFVPGLPPDKDQFDLKNTSAALGGPFNPTPPLGTWVSLNRAEFNTMPFNGLGRVRTSFSAATVLGPFSHPDKHLVNYQIFPADGFKRDPEMFSGQFVAGNVSWTYPDVHNFYLGAMNSAREIVMPSFHRPWTAAGTVPVRYTSLRPPGGPGTANPYFPPFLTTEPDVKNVDSADKVRMIVAGTPAVVNNDSYWMYAGSPILVGPDGRKYTVLYAPFVLDMDGKVNVNVHGNIRGPGETNAGNHGLGPWEVSLKPVLPVTAANVLKGNTTTRGRYGKDGQPGAANSSWTGPALSIPYWSALDLDGVQNAPLYAAGLRFRLPGEGTHPKFACLPDYSASTTYGNASAGERFQHPALFNAFSPIYLHPGPPPRMADDRRFGPSNLEALLRHGGTGSPSSMSDLFRLCFSDFPTSRLKLTTASFDLGRAGGAPWLAGTPPAYTLAAGAIYPTGLAVPTPSTSAAPPTGGEFVTDWRSIAGRLPRLSLNRTFVAYPAPSVTTGRLVSNALSAGHADRQAFAKQIFQRLRLATTGVADANAPLPAPGSDVPPDADRSYRAMRWLAQLAVNIVDYMDTDDYITPFNWYAPRPITAASNTSPITITSIGHGLATGAQVEVGGVLGNTAANGKWTITVLNANQFSLNSSTPNGAYAGGGVWTTGDHWVYGVEMPKLLMNEAYAEMINTSGDPGGPTGGAILPFRVSVWLELLNPLKDDPNLKELPTNVFGGVRLRMPPAGPALKYSIYKVQIIKPGASYTDANLGEPAAGDIYTEVDDYEKHPGTATSCDVEVVGPNQIGSTVKYSVETTANGKNDGFYLLGPKDAFPGTAISTLPVKEEILAGVQKGLTYELPVTPPAPQPALLEADRLRKPAVLLRRLACPNLPDNPLKFLGNGALNPDYNPYVTVDTIPALDLNDKATKNVNGVNAPVTAPLLKAYGRTQPYAASLITAQTPDTNTGLPGIQPYPSQPQHTFFRHNGIEATPPTASSATLQLPFDWLPHLDRPLASPLELLHVSMVRPHELTTKFMIGTQPHQRFTHTHLAPDGVTLPVPHTTGKLVWFDQDARIYRFFEMVDSGHRAQGIPFDGRIPGKININTAFWKDSAGATDATILQALADHQLGLSSYPAADVTAIVDKLLASRTPDASGIPTAADRPFKSLATGATPATDTQFLFPGGPGGGAHDTLFRQRDPFGGIIPYKSLFEVSGNNPVHKYELLSKIFNNVTTRSNVFAVWVTAGFFEVTDGPISKAVNVKRAGNDYVVTPQAMSGSINGVPWIIQDRMHVWVGDQVGEVTSTTASTFKLSFATAPAIAPKTGDLVSVKGVLGREVGADENRQIRHRMFAIIDRSNLVMPDITMATTQSIAAPPALPAPNPPKLVNVSAVSGTAMLTAGLPVTTKWSMVPKAPTALDTGIQLIIDQGKANEEIIMVRDVSIAPAKIEAVFTKAHAAGATLKIGVVAGPFPGSVFGNPGPQPAFDLRKHNAVVPYFSIIQ